MLSNLENSFRKSFVHHKHRETRMKLWNVLSEEIGGVSFCNFRWCSNQGDKHKFRYCVHSVTPKNILENPKPTEIIQ